MTNHIETKIGTITDSDFQTMVAELCLCADWHIDDFENKTLANFFSMLVKA
jgi:hypothetical protein